MTHPVPPTVAASTRSALLAHPALDDCAVVVRQRPDGVAETVAYVVRRFAAGDGDLRAHLAAAGVADATTFVPVAAIPYLSDGRPDLAALTSQPLADATVAAAWEDAVRGIAGVSHVAAVVREARTVDAALHVDDLLSPELRPARRGGPRAPSKAPPAHEEPAAGARFEAAESRPAIADGGALPPDEAGAPEVLSDVLCRAALGGRRARRGLTYVAADGSERYQSYSDLLGYAEQLLTGLRAMGLAPGDRVLLLLPRHRDFIPAFWACVLGGLIPVPLSAPARYDQPSPALDAVRGAWRVTRPAAVLTSGAAAAVAMLAPAGDRCQVRGLDSLRGGSAAAHHLAQPGDVALLMMTSGSTGTPKAVTLTHGNLLARTRASQIVNGFTDADVSLNWMPLDHVAGLIYFHLRDVYLGCHQVHVPTPAVVQNPCAWLDALERYGATVTFAPNFAYGLLLDRESELASRRWDLSRVRYVLNGAEAIVARTARRFLTALAPHGLRATAMRPAWGMSETSSGVTYSDAFTLELTTDDQPFVEVGAPIPSVVMRVVDDQDLVVNEGVVGRLQISGATVTHGYFDAPGQTREAFTSDGWFKTGDLAVIRGGRVTVTGREKDVIIVNSVNYYSHAIESVVDAVDGVEPSFTAAVAVRRGTDTDSLAIFFVPRSADPATLAALLPRIRADVARSIGITAEYLVPVAPREIPKTSLGKIQRTELARQLTAGEFDDRLKVVAALLGTDDVVPSWFFRRVWRAKAAVTIDASLDGRRVVLFDPGAAAGDKLRRELGARGASVVSVEAGTGFARLAADRFAIAPDRAADYASLADALRAEGPIEHVMHAWSVAPAEVDDDARLASGAVSVLLLIQALSTFAKATVDKGARTSVTLTCVATQTHRVMTGDEIAPVRSAAAAIIASAPQELDWLRARHVDLPWHDPGFAARLAVDEHTTAGSDRDVAYRDGRRFVWGLERASLAAASWDDVPLVRGGCYLVTGGTGGVAEHVVALLREVVEARVLLVGRRPLEAAASRHIARLVADGSVAYARVDVCDGDALAAAVAAQERQWDRRLDGVVHLAGSYHETAIDAETASALADAIRPKLAGTMNVHRLLAARGGGVLIAGSSVAGIFGGASIASYAAACACQSAFAQQHAGRGAVQQYCMAWSTWDDTGVSRGYRSDLPRSRGYLPMSPARARVSLLAGLAAGQGTLVVGLDGAHRSVRRYLGAPTPELVELFHDSGDPTAVEAVERVIAAAEIHDRFGLRSTAIATCVRNMPLLPGGEVDRRQLASGGGMAAPRPRQAPRSEAERALAGVWRRVLNTSDIDIDDNFFDLGGDSLTALRLTGAIRDRLGVELPPRAVFEASTFAELASAIEAARPAVKPAAPVAGTAAAPLSEGQRALWLLHTLAPASAALNIGFTARLRGGVDSVALAAAWQALVDRHPTLRTVFPVEDGVPVRRVLTGATVPFAVAHVPGWSDGAVLAAIAAEIDRPFDLDTGPMLRVRLWQRGDDAFLAATFHHIAIDGGSLWLCLSELGDLYDRACRGPLPAVAEDRGFERYLQRQARVTTGPDRARHLEFWRSHLDGRGQPASFATDRSRPAQPRYAGASHRLALGAPLAGRLRQLAREHRCTVQMVVCALFETLLARHTGQDDVTVGYLSSGRSAAELDRAVGYLANPLPLRARVPGDLPFAALLQQTRDAVLEAMTHDELPFPLVAQALEPQREPGRSPLFQVLFVYEKPTVLGDQNAGAFALGHPGATMTLGGLALESLPFAAQREGQYDVTLVLGDVGDDLEVSFDYRTELYDASTIERLGRQLVRLAESAASRPEAALAELVLLDDAELASIRAVNDTRQPLPATTFHALIAGHAAARPESPALAFEGATLSYGELDSRTDRLAAALVSRGLSRGAIVGLCAERSFDLVVGALAILKAGGAFLPLDPAYPPERLAFMLDDSNAPIVVTHRGLESRLGPYTGSIIDIDAALAAAPASAPVAPVTERDLAYVIYTSGSTGRPKGVLLEHRGLVNVALEQQRLFGARPGSRVLQFASISFDAAVFDLAMALGSGATLHLASPEAILPGAPLLRTLCEQAITIVTLPPSALIATPDAELPALEVITVAGEACPAELVDRWAPGRRFFNLYGPTEATIWATAMACASGGGTPPIGRPIANTEVHVLDGRGALAPIGVAGELYLGGVGLARGYHRREDLTRAVFVPHPFGPEGATLYKTGDRARLRASGELEFLGRLDAQVKMRGYRIELGEIDARLAELPGVEQAVTVVAGGALDAARLVAYVTPRAGASLAGHELRAALRARLPEFMVPSVVTVLDALPLTPSGKIDRARLPAAGETAAPAETFVAPAAGLEAVVADVWKDVLGVSRIGVTDNFFDLGGTSLLIARVHARLETLAPGAFSMVDLFGLPTVQMLAARLAGAGSEAASGTDRRGALAAGRARLAAAAGRRAAAREGGEPRP